MSVWIVAAAMALVTTALLMRPLFRDRSCMAPAGDATDLALYRVQLAELETEISRGLSPKEEAGAARTEIERRILRAGGQRTEAQRGEQSPARPSLSRGQGSAIGFITLAAISAVALYMTLGTPELPSMPLAERLMAGADGEGG